MSRALAICKGGPLDGVALSVTLAENGAPPPLESRAEIAGVLYVPASEITPTVDHQLLFLTETVDADGNPATDGIDHDRAFEYVPEGE